MAYEQRDNSGALFKNSKREKDSQPNATGNAMIDGIAYRVSAWTKKDKNGNPWQSLSFTKVETKGPESDGGGKPQSLYDEPINDEIPF